METSKKSESRPTDNFKVINECAVDDISLELFYRPHTITLLAVSIAGVIYFSFVRDESNVDDNIWAGLLCIIFFLLIISVLSFPNGPFTRPHPAVWRMVFGLSILYLLALLFLLFQDYKTARGIILWIDPKLKDFRIDMDKEYGVNCSDITIERVWSHLDVFAVGHFVGWAFKAVLVRHCGILWAMSIMWEVTEIAFAHLLPNFVECWWDILILDILLCNGIGIWVGLKICKIMEMREYKWVSISIAYAQLCWNYSYVLTTIIALISIFKLNAEFFISENTLALSNGYEIALDIHSTTGKLKRAVLQFTPVSWTHVRWLDPTCTYMRFFAVCQLVIFWQISELNTFFLKHIFEMPPSHPIVIGRLTFFGIMVAPSARQYYSFVTDPGCKRLGSQCWVLGAVMFTESLLCIKNGKALFERTQALNIILWVLVMLLFSVLCVYGFVAWQWYFQRNKANDHSPLLKKKQTIEKTDNKSTCGAELSQEDLRQRYKHNANGSVD